MAQMSQRTTALQSRVDFPTMAAARLQLHHAVQLVHAISNAYLDPVADDSHANLGWDAEVYSLLGRSTPALNHSFEISIRLDEPSVCFHNHGTTEKDVFHFEGRTLKNAQTTPTHTRRPTLPPGARWHTDGFFSAVLDAPALLASDLQLQSLWHYLQQATVVSRELAGTHAS